MNVLLPNTVAALHQHLVDQPEARIMAGGTDLLVRLRAASTTPETLICLEKIDELKEIVIQESSIRIGAGATLSDIHANKDITAHLPLLHQAASVFASPLIRNMATIGGNVCMASPAGDSLPALYVMEALVELISSNGTRTLPLEEFIQGPGKNDLQSGEILSAIIIPIPEGFSVHHFEKVGQREALAIAVVSMAGMVALDKGVITKARFAWGSVGPTIMRSKEVEDALIGQKMTLSVLRKVSELAKKAVTPISDVRASADYRRQVAGNLLLRLAAL